MKNKIEAHNKSSVSVKPIRSNTIKTVIDGGTAKHHDSIIDKFKHGLEETGHFVKAHTVGEVEKIAKAVDNKAHSVANTIKDDVVKGAHMASTAIKSGASDVLKGAAAAENALLPSSTKILMETGLAVAGLGFVAYMVMKVM